MLRLAKVWNSDHLLHNKAVQDLHEQSPLRTLALTNHFSDAEQLKKQKNANKADTFVMEVPAEQLKKWMSLLTSNSWSMSVNMHLSVMEILIAEILGGSVDISHAQQLEEEASMMDELVQEGRNDTSLVTEGELDLELLDSVQENIYNASDLVDKMISDEKVSVFYCVHVL